MWQAFKDDLHDLLQFNAEEDESEAVTTDVTASNEPSALVIRDNHNSNNDNNDNDSNHDSDHDVEETNKNLMARLSLDLVDTMNNCDEGGSDSDSTSNSNYQEEDALREISNAAMQIGRSAASWLQQLPGTTTAAAAAVWMTTTSSAAALEEDEDEYFLDEAQQLGTGRDYTSIGNMKQERESHSLDHTDADSIQEGEVAFIGLEQEQESAGVTSNSTTTANTLQVEALDVVRVRRALTLTESETKNLRQIVEERSQEIHRLQSLLREKAQSVSSMTSSSIILAKDTINKTKNCNGSCGVTVNFDEDYYTLRRELKWMTSLLIAKNTDDPLSHEASLQCLRLFIHDMRQQAVLGKGEQKGAMSHAETIEALEAAQAVIKKLKRKIDAINTRP